MVALKTLIDKDTNLKDKSKLKKTTEPEPVIINSLFEGVSET